MNTSRFDDDATSVVDEVLLAEIRAEAARRTRAGQSAEGPSLELSESGGGAAEDGVDPVATVDHPDEDMPVVDGYGALREIGRGGFSRVYEAMQFDFERWVAVKVLNEALSGSDEAAEFERECRLMGVLSRHPNIVTVLESTFTGSGLPSIVMELYPDGSYLDVLQGSGPLGLEEVLSVAVSISGALATGHRQGVVHGDVKPQNIFRAEHGAALGDFGIASLINHGFGPAKTRLSLYYAAPEVIERGAAALSPFSDQYSLAATLYTLATGERPFRTSDSSSTRELLLDALTAPTPRLGDEFPAALDEALQQAMTREPALRHRDMRAFATAIGEVEAGLGYRPTEMRVLTGSGRYAAQVPGQSPSRDLSSSGQILPAPAGSGIASGTGPRRRTESRDLSGEQGATTIVRPSQPVDAPPAPAPPPAKRHRVRWLLVAAVLVALAAGAVALLWPPAGDVVGPPGVLDQIRVDGQRNGLVVRWDAIDANPPVLFYRVQWRGADQSFSEAREMLVDADETSAAITGLDSGTEYTVRVAAENAQGAAEWTESGGSTLPDGVPDPPPTLKVSPLEEGLAVEWDEPWNGGSPITGYVVQWRGADQSFSEAREMLVDSDETSAEITGLDSGTEYTVRVAAENAQGAGGWAESEGIPESGVEPLPPPPLDEIRVDGQRNGLVVRWEALDANPPVLFYRVQWRGTDQSFSEAREMLVDSDETSAATSGLTSDTEYWVRVAAENAEGAGDWSAESRVVTLSDGVPDPPTLRVSPLEEGLAVAWDEPSDGGSSITGYVVELVDSSGRIDESRYAAPASSAEILDLTGGETYRVRVAAENENGRGGWVEERAIPRKIVPPSPDGLAVVESYRGLHVTWEDPPAVGPPITAYLVDLLDSQSTVSTRSVSSDDRSAEFTGLVSGRLYDVRLVALNGDTESEPVLAQGVPLDRVAFVSDHEGRDAIYYMDARVHGDAVAASDPVRLTDGEAWRREGSPSWSPDGSWIAFQRRHPEGTHWQVFVKDITTGEERQLVCGRDNGWGPSWSPDGRSIAYARGSGGNDIWTINIETGEARSLKDKYDADDAFLSWSPDGNAIAFARRDHDPRRSSWSNSRNPREIRVLDGVASEATELDVSLLTEGYEAGHYSTPEWSPDGNEIAYSVSLPGSQLRHIDVMDGDGNRLRRLTSEHHDDDPSWSPNGGSIAFARGSEGSRGLYVVNSSGGEPTLLLGFPGNDYWAPSWAPNSDLTVAPTFDC